MTKSTYIFLYLLLGIVLLFGIFLPLMENDSAQHASMAMRMMTDNDYLHIFKGNAAYLDKPHMHFWLSAFSMELLGKHVWAYRLPAILLTIISAFAVSRLAEILYKNKEISRLSALMFLSSQAIILSLHDVRTDAVLTAFTVLALWQWSLYLEKEKFISAILGGAFTALAYSTKGLIAIAVIGLFLFIRVLHKNYWHRLLSYKLLTGIIAFVLFSLPVLYAYWVQFGIEGIEFITYGQVTGRYSGEDFGTASKKDYFFFFHTILWAVLPWSFWFYFSLFARWKKIFRGKEIASILTILLFVIAMNFSSFKLPHYLNIMIPLLSVFTAAQVVDIFGSRREWLKNTLNISAIIIASLGTILLLVLAIYVFPIQHIYLWFLLLVAVLVAVFMYKKAILNLEKSVILLASFVLITNIYLNSSFYPQLVGNYQASTNMSQLIEEKGLAWEDVVGLANERGRWNVDWTLGRTIKEIDEKDINQREKPYWLISMRKSPEELGLNKKDILEAIPVDSYRISMLKLKFLNPKTRSSALKKAWLIRIK